MIAVGEEVNAAIIDRARTAQTRWGNTSLRDRLAVIRRIRNEIATSADALMEAFPLKLRANRAERLAAELMPLADACRFLEQEASAVLAVRRRRARRTPFWLRGIALEERRDPVGFILLIGPANYPLFLPAVQALQALVAGNAVAVKPGRGGYDVMKTFEQLTLRAGLPQDVLFTLGEDIGNAKSLIAHGVDKIILTGSADTGRAVYRQAAERLTPLTLELSGFDPVFVQQGADLRRASDAIRFGLSWNGGETCIAPRRIFVASSVAERFEQTLRALVPEAGSLPVMRYQTDEQALALAAQSHYALGASVFGPVESARAFAARIPAGIVVVNDMIMPTADPRAAFGGRGQSGFGTTRGAEGLRQLTVTKTILVQRKRRLRHLEVLPPHAEELFKTYLHASCATYLCERLRASLRLFQVLARGRRHAS